MCGFLSDGWNGVKTTCVWAVTPHGTPVLAGAMAWLECEARQFVTVGDHTLVIGEVTAGKLVNSAEALSSAYTGWTYSG